MMIGSNIITVSRLRSLNSCPRQHYYRYEAGLRSDGESKALRLGRIYHVALDMLWRGEPIESVCEVIRENYSTCPPYCDQFDWEVERETVLNLIMGYQWRWQGDGYELIESERSFRLPILNPETGAATPLFEQAGKKDKKARLPDSRIALVEHKTTSDSIAPDSDYWSILRIDPQVSIYFASDSELETIIYDVTRKPAIAPKLIPVVDAMGFKVVLDSAGTRVFLKDGKPRQSGDSEKGWEVQSRRETAAEFGERLRCDIGERPEFYFARYEVPRTLADVAAWQQDLWQSQQMLRHRQKKSLWTRQPGQACSYCEFKAPCFNNVYPINGSLPTGYVRVENVHPELEEINHVNSNSTEASGAACAAAV